jgi:alkylated DNA repair dioxygenase AlkB
MASLLELGSVWVEEDFLPDSEALFASLLASVAWDGRMRARRAASFGVPYNYSGLVWPEAPFPPPLVHVLERVSARLGYRPNNCLAHHYPAADSTMGFHRDATDELVPGTGIAVVSLGVEWAITFRSEADRRVQESHRLPAGSLLYMSPETQAGWKHAILAEEGVTGGRISLTFRRLRLSAAGKEEPVSRG